MKRVIPICLLAAILITPLAPSTQSPQRYEHHQTFLKKLDALSLLLASSYGKNNPFSLFTSIAELTAEMYEKSSAIALNKKSIRYQEHSIALHKLLVELDHGVSQALACFLNNKPRDKTFRLLWQTSRKAGNYISTHLQKQARTSKAMRKITRSQKRFLGTISGIGIFGGVFKYIVLGIVGTAIIGTLWKVYRAITHDSRALHKQIKSNRKGVSGRIRTYKDELITYVEQTAMHNPEMRMEKKPQKSLWRKTKIFFSCFRSDAKQHALKNEHIAKTLSWAIKVIRTNHETFGFTTAETVAQMGDACTHLEDWYKKPNQ